MTITTAQNSAIGLGNGVTTAFTFTFPAVAAADIFVIYTDSSGTQTQLNNTQYTLTLNPTSVGSIWSYGGTVTYPTVGSPIANGTSLTIYRELPLLQDISLSNQGNQYPRVTESGLDTLCMQIQQINASQVASIQFPIVDSTALSAVLPAAAARAGKYVSFDASGNVIVSTGTTASSISPLAAYFTPTGSALPPSGNGMYAPSTNVLGLASNGGLGISIANDASAVDYFQFIGSAATSPVAYNQISLLGTDSKVGLIVNTKGTTTSGSQYYGTTDSSGKYYFKINGAIAFEATDTWWNPNVSYQGATTAWPVFSSGALAGGPDNIAVIGCNSSIYPSPATGVTLMYCARGVTGSHHFTNNGVMAHVNVAAPANPNGNDTYCTANSLWLSGSAVGSGLDCLIYTNKTANPADAAVGMVFYNQGTGGYRFFSDNTVTPVFHMFRAANAVNCLYSMPAATGGLTYLGVEGTDTNAAIALVSKGTGDVRIYTNNTGALQALFPHTANAVNAVSITGGATGTNPSISVGGPSADASRGLSFFTRGSSAVGHFFYDGGALQVSIFGGSTSNSYLQLAGGVNSTVISAQGGTNATMSFYTTGTGGFAFLTSNTAKTILSLADAGNVTANTGNFVMGVAAKGLVLKQGANGKCGTFVLTGTAAVTVNNTSLAISDAITISLNTVGGTVGALPSVKTITASTSFTVSGTAGDTSTYNYAITSNAA